MIELIKLLSDAPGVSGFEVDVRAILDHLLSEIATTKTDNLGSIVAKLKAGNDRPRVMIAAHMDEIGFMVTHVTKEGFIYFCGLGGWSEHVMLAQKVVVKTRKGDMPGVVGSKPPHILEQEERKKVVKAKNMFIDIGARDEEHAIELGVRPGDPVVPYGPVEAMADGDMVMGKAFDDRIGCAVMMEAMRRLASRKLKCAVYGVGTVQEEVGVRGARTSVGIVEPDLALISEVALAGDTPGIRENEAKARIGKGPVIYIYDQTLIPNPNLRDFVADVAEREGIPLQFQASSGGTDGGHISLHGTGVPSVVIGVPTRYIHSHLSVAGLEDVENAVKLFVSVISSIDRDTRF